MVESNLKVLLAENKMKSKELAEELGVTVAAVSKWISNANYPPVPTLFKIAHILNCKTDDLYTYKEE